MTYSSQIEVLWQVFLCFFNASVDVGMRFLPVLEEEVDNSAMVEQIGAVRVELISQLQLSEGVNECLGKFPFVFLRR